MRGDALVDRGADKLHELANDLAARGGLGADMAPVLAEDAEFLRRLKPSLIVARVRGEAPTDGKPPAERPKRKPAKPKTPGEGPNPLLIVGGALVLGIVLAKVIDWRGHAHPRVD